MFPLYSNIKQDLSVGEFHMVVIQQVRYIYSSLSRMGFKDWDPMNYTTLCNFTACKPPAYLPPT